MSRGPKGQKRPADVVGNAVHVMRVLTGEIVEEGSPVPARAAGGRSAARAGRKMAKVHWKQAKQQHFPDTTVPGAQHDVDFMVKDSKRFADSGGWGWAVFNYDATSDTFAPGTLANEPPQANDAKCGFACHTIVEARDYVFTDYGKR
jgi:Cytochrome P460